VAWRLRHYLAFEPGDVEIPRKAVIGAGIYGFSLRLNARMVIELRRFYQSLIRKCSPAEFDKIRAQGALVQYGRKHLGSIEPDVEEVLRQLAR
jgi:hypothetical protein